MIQIGNYAFEGCVGLNAVRIPDTVTNSTIISSNDIAGQGLGMFSGCINLREIALSVGMTALHQNRFRGCTNLKSIQIPSAVTYINLYAFNKCDNLTDVLFENTVGWRTRKGTLLTVTDSKQNATRLKNSDSDWLRD